MFGYNLKPYEMFGYPFFFGVLAVVVARTFPSPEMNVFLWAFEINVALVGVFYLLHESCKYVDGQATDKLILPAPVKAEKQYLNLNTTERYNQGVVTLQINSVMAFNKMLITQKTGGLDVDMTEGFWVVKRPDADESEWVKAGGTSRADFVDMIGRGVAWGAYKRIGGKQKPAPENWRKISQLAQGYPLPRWEQLPKQ